MEDFNNDLQVVPLELGDSPNSIENKGSNMISLSKESPRVLKENLYERVQPERNDRKVYNVSEKKSTTSFEKFENNTDADSDEACVVTLESSTQRQRKEIGSGKTIKKDSSSLVFDDHSRRSSIQSNNTHIGNYDYEEEIKTRTILKKQKTSSPLQAKSLEKLNEQITGGDDTDEVTTDAGMILQTKSTNAQVEHDNNSGDMHYRKLKINKRKIKKKSQDSSLHKHKNVEMKTEEETQTEQSGEADANAESGKIIGIHVHKTDCLQSDVLLQHPLVKVHLLNANTGKYLKKSCTSRSVSFYYEKNIDYIQPLMTKAFYFKTARGLIPTWEEILVFNENIQYILSDDPPVIFMFEIIDFVNYAVASSQYTRLGPDSGWHKVAWGFLKPMGVNNHSNIEKKLRIQLYRPQSIQKREIYDCDAYSWWFRRIWERYPATLYVTVKGITPATDIPPALRSNTALQKEWMQDILPYVGEDKKEETNSGETVNLNLNALHAPVIAHPGWSRLPAQSSKIPNQRKLAIPTPSKGCFCLKFSNSGLYLACSMRGESSNTIKLFTIPDGKENAAFVGHQGLVYELSWSSSDNLLLTASADCTACIWDAEKKRNRCLQMLPHPSFVYSAQFHKTKSWLLATGCNDHVVRLWLRGHKATQYNLIETLERHDGFVTTVCFEESFSLFSADSVGSVLLWSCCGANVSRQSATPWELKRELSIRELKGTAINKLKMHPGGRRLLIHARDNLLRMVDVETSSIIQWFKGAISQGAQTSCCLSSCGSLVLAPSEEGAVCVWNADTGAHVATYTAANASGRMCDVDYHPFDHMIAFCSYGTSSRVTVCVYNKQADPVDIGLQLVNVTTTPREIDAHITNPSQAANYCVESNGSIANSVRNEMKKAKKLVKYIKTSDEPNSQSSSTGYPCLSPRSPVTVNINCGANDNDKYPDITERQRQPDLAYLIQKIDEVLSLPLSSKNSIHDISVT